MTGIIDLLESLVFDNGMIGLIVVTFIIIMCVSFTIRLKETSLFSILLLLFLGIEYFSRGVDGSFVWHGIFAFLGALFVGVIASTKFINEQK